MSNQQMDPIEQVATGQIPFPNVNSTITKVAASNEQTHQVGQLNNRRSGSAESTLDNLKTLSDLISDHIPETQREEMMKLLFEKMNSRQVENLRDIDKEDVDKTGGISI